MKKRYLDIQESIDEFTFKKYDVVEIQTDRNKIDWWEVLNWVAIIGAIVVLVLHMFNPWDL